jgi:hypothetical protein
VRRLVADARAVGAGRSYLVEHSAGSGKSNTIAWTAHQLSNAHDAQDRKVFDKVVVITDRVVLAPGGSVAGDPAKIEGGTAAKCNVPVAEAISDEAVLPERVQEALGQLVGAAKEGLLALSVEVGLGVLRELLEQEVDEIVRAKGKRNRERTAVRHGHEAGEVTLGAGAWGSTGRGSARRTASQRWRWGPMITSLSVTSSPTSCWSGCWPGSRRESTAGRRSRSVSRSKPMPGRRRSQRCPERSCSAPAVCYRS